MAQGFVCFLDQKSLIFKWQVFNGKNAVERFVLYDGTRMSATPAIFLQWG